MENKDEAIHGMDIRVNAIKTLTNVSECMSIQQIQQAAAQDDNFQQLRVKSLHVDQRVKINYTKTYCSFKDDMAVNDGVIMKAGMNGRCIITPEVLKAQVLDHLHINHMGKEKNKTPSMWFYILG